MLEMPEAARGVVAIVFECDIVLTQFLTKCNGVVLLEQFRMTSSVLPEVRVKLICHLT